MKRLLAGLALALLVGSVAHAIQYIKFEQITTTNAAVYGLTAANINAGTSHPMATAATCRLEGAEVRYTLDGTTPTSTVGTLLEIGDTLVMNGNDILNAFRFTRTTATNATLDCHESSIA